MKKRQSKTSRRKILGALGTVGAAGALGGIGTSSLFTDQETVQSTVTAGTLDLKLDWRVLANGSEIVSQVEPTDVDGEVIVALKDVKPCDEICLLFSIHNDTNPAWLWLSSEQISDRENGQNEPEIEAEGNTQEVPESISCDFLGKLNGWDTEQEIFTNVEPDAEDTPSGSYQGDDVYTLYLPNGTELEVMATPVGWNSAGEVTELDLDILTSGYGFCNIVVKASNDTKTFLNEEECETGTITVDTPDRNGDDPEVSHIDLYACDAPEDDDGGELDECAELEIFHDDNQDCIPDSEELVVASRDTVVANSNLVTLLDGFRGIVGGDEDTPKSPFYPSTSLLDDVHYNQYGVTATDRYSESLVEDQSRTQWIAIKITVPCDCGNEIQSDSFGLSLKFYAEQARNNPEPDNPETGNTVTDTNLVPGSEGIEVETN